MAMKNSSSASSSRPVYKLVFIHHSVGGHWLEHGNGNLVRELNHNNFYVNDITYGWEPPELTDSAFKRAKRKALGVLKQDHSGAYGIGDRTDIGQMYDWFSGQDTAMIMRAVYRENNETDRFGGHANDGKLVAFEPDGENEIVMFKSCYPNTLFKGKPGDTANDAPDPPRNYTADSDQHTIANAKRTFNEVLKYFKSRPDKFFVVVTPPPRNELPENGMIARGFANWLYNDWLKENNYPYNNVMVFDLYNVLTSAREGHRSDTGEETGNHHRMWKGKEQHIVAVAHHTLAYPRKAGDNHPSSAGLQKATEEFVPLLVEKHRLWKQGIAK
ncbi:MAG: hypothetical protein VB050_17005 [Geobacteraceae bacterium]|nr:hypothetical protein [Geobacteraceae bacterium]